MGWNLRTGRKLSLHLVLFFSLRASIGLSNFKFILDWANDQVVFVIPDATDECVLKGAHLSICGHDVNFYKVNEISLLEDAEDDYCYKDFWYAGRREGSPRVLSTDSSSSSGGSSSSDDDDDLNDDDDVSDDDDDVSGDDDDLDYDGKE